MIAAKKVIGRTVSAATMSKLAIVGLAPVVFGFISVGYIDPSKILSGEAVLKGP